MIFEHARSRLTRIEVARGWPTDRAPRPHTRTLFRWLETAVAEGHLARSGQGLPHDPFRYYLPNRQAELKPVQDFRDDPLFAELDALHAKTFGPRR